MAVFEISRDVAYSVDEAWARVTDWSRHGDLIAFTEVVTTSSGINGRTRIGPFGFDDPMDITVWDPPRRCRLEKRGRLVPGWAEITVEPRGSGARVRWTEDVDVRGVPGFLDPVKRAVSRRIFGRLLDGLLA